MFVSTKTRPVIKFIPLGQIGTNADKARTIEELFEDRQLVPTTAHAVLEHLGDKGGHAQIGLGSLDPQPIGNILAQRDCYVFHVINLV